MKKVNALNIALGNRAQISVELIVVLAAVVALILILVSRLQATGSDAAKKFDSKVDDIFKEIDKI